MIQLLQSVLKEPMEWTVQTYIHLHLMVGYLVKHVIVRLHCAILFMDAISSRVRTNTIYLYFEINIAFVLHKFIVGVPLYLLMIVVYSE